MDDAQRIVESVIAARQGQIRLSVTGTASKRDWLPSAAGEMLVMTEHSGIVAYDPSELVVTVRAGTTIRELEAQLAQAGQALAFEPPRFYGSGTAGGMVAAGLSGPSRPWAGALRDAVLGVELVNGLGERVKFGGQVMKNVAGYDVSRLMTGAYGALGALLEISLRVQPVHVHVLTLGFELDAQQANNKCRELAQRYLPLTASWWSDGRLWLRLSGSEAGVRQAAREIGGEVFSSTNLWRDVRDHNLNFFKPNAPGGIDRTEQKLWRLIMPPASPMPEAAMDLDASALAVEWAGGLRWVWHAQAEPVAAYARAHGGWAWALGHPLVLDAVQAKVMQAVKEAFDPEGLFVSPLDFRQRSAD